MKVKEPLSVGNRRRYGFVKPHLIALFTVVDAIGSRLIRPGSDSPPTQPRRILLINLAHMGDVLMSTPAVHAVRQAQPSAHLTMLVGPWSAGVLKNNPYLDSILVRNVSWWDRSRNRFRFGFAPLRYASMLYACTRGYYHQLLKTGEFDVSIDFKSFFQENLAVYEADIPWRVGFGIYGGRFLLNRVVDYPWHRHVVERNLALVQGAGIDVSIGVGIQPPRVFLSEQDETAADAFLQSHGFKSRLVALHIGAGYPSKRWPVDRYALLADRLTEQYGAQVVLVGGTDDLPLIDHMIKVMKARPLVAAGQLSVTGTATLLKRCQLFIGNDSGPAHLATAVGIPTIVLFSGENDAAFWRPYSDNCTLIQKRPDCWPCGKKKCGRNHDCMTAINIDEVIERVSEIGGFI